MGYRSGELGCAQANRRPRADKSLKSCNTEFVLNIYIPIS